MEPEMITLILNAVLGVFILLGFLTGLRGLKKQVFSLVSFVIQLVLIFFLTPVFSKIILGINIGDDTIQGMITSGVNDALGEQMASSALVKSIVDALPLMIVNIVTTILLLLAFGFLFKIIGAIVYKIMFKKDKIKTVEKCEMVDGTPQMVKKTIKRKKYRLYGGLVGAFHGFAFALAMFLPLLGLVNIASDLTGVKQSASAEVQTESSFELKPISELLNESIPEEVLSYIKAVDGSILFKIGSVANLSETTFNLVARTSINGKSVSLGHEIRSLVNTYDSFVSFMTPSGVDSLDFEVIFNDMKQNPDKYDFNKLYSIVDKLFDSNLLSSVEGDALKFVADMLVDSADEQSKNLMKHIKTAIYNYVATGSSLKTDIKAFIGVFEIALDEHILSLADEEEFNVDSLTDILLEDNNKVLKDILIKITSSNLLQKFILEFANYGLEELEVVFGEQLEFVDDYQPDIKTIDTAQNYSIKADELEGIIIDALSIYDKIEVIDTDAIQEDFYEIFADDVDVEGIINDAGDILNKVVSMSILKDTGVFASLCDAMSHTEYNQYLDFELLKTSNTLSTQFGYLAESVGELKESGIIAVLRNSQDYETKEIIKSVVEKLAVEDTSGTNVSKIVAPLLKCTLLKNAVEYGLGEASEYLENALKEKNPDAVLNKFNTSKLMTEQENDNFIILLNNLVQFVNNVDFDNLLSDNFIDELLENSDNFANLGRAMDSIKNSTIFADYDEDGVTKEGVYKCLLNALSGIETFEEYFDFSVAKMDNFVWEDATTKLQTLANNLDEIQIGDKSLIKYILTSSDYNNILDELRTWVNNAPEGEDRVVGLTELFEIELIKPTSVKIINLINNTIKEFVDEEETSEEDKIGKNIVEINTLVDIKSQASEINNVINKAILIDFDDITSKGVENMSHDDLDLIDNLLDAMAVNASREDGVFKESYNALLLLVANTVNDEVKSFVGDALGAGIVKFNGDKNITSYKDDIINIIDCALDFDLSTFDIENLTETQKTQLNSLLDAIEICANKEGSPFSLSYNALIAKTTNLINENVKDMVGSAGTEIEIIDEPISLTVDDRLAVRTILNEVIDVAISDKFKVIKVETLNIEEFCDFADMFDVNTTTDLFSQTKNALYLYVINTINATVANECEFNYYNYTGEEIADVDSTEYIIKKAQDLFVALDEVRDTNADAGLIDVANTNEFKAFVNSLNQNELLKDSYNNIDSYLESNGINLEDILNN